MNKMALVVDDCAVSRMITRQVLVSAGYNVLETEDGNGALHALNRVPVDVLISDFNMRGMDGAALIKAVRRLPGYDKLPVFILSSESDTDYWRRGMAAGATAWLAKPLQPQQIVRLLPS